MKKTITYCDLCCDEIPIGEAPFVIKTDKGARKKKIGCDIVLTPRGKRLHAGIAGKAMIRVNASFYCSSHDNNLDELHFHKECLDEEVRARIIEFYTGDTK